MCGIAGIVQLNDRPLDVTLLEAMTTALAHRGPDGEGYLFAHPRAEEKPVIVRGPLRSAIAQVSRDLGRHRMGFGHRRLAIIDLTPLGQQPMGSADGAVWITYNGEVYNAPELRRELTSLGHHFRSTTDTEVVLESYREWGAGCLSRFNGMFAFALWDRPNGLVWCARDRFGIKPFYYRFGEGRFLFASEIKALLADPKARRAPNERTVYEYLTRGRQDFCDETLFEGVRQLGPGQSLCLRLDGSAASEPPTADRWWELETSPQVTTEAEAVPRLRELLEDAVRLHMRADVPIGSCLSGGLDSSSLVCLMSRMTPAGASPVRTFTLCHDDARYDERPYSRAVVGQTGALSQEVSPDPDQLMARMSELLWHQDEPVAGTSVLGQWAVMQAAGGAGVKVLLDGQGADEMLLGYPGLWGSYVADLLRGGHWLAGAREWRAWQHVHGQIPSTALAGVVRGLTPDALAGGLRRRITGESAWITPAFTRRVRESGASVDRPTRPGASVLEGHIRRAVAEDLPALLHYEDRNAMALSIEARLPFLDHRVVEFLARVPPQLKIREGMTKVLLREAMRGILPESVRRRPDKMGFVTPENDWLRGPWRSAIAETLQSDRLRARPYWRADAMQTLFDRFCERRSGIGPTVWRWVSLEWWMRRMCD